MKLKALIMTLILITLTSSAFAQSFLAHAYVSVTPGVVRAEVYNPYAIPLFCSGRTIGLLSTGQTVHSFFNSIVPVGQNRHSFVYTNTFPFVDGRAEIHCRF